MFIAACISEAFRSKDIIPLGVVQLGIIDKKASSLLVLNSYQQGRCLLAIYTIF